jgi:hypothetical protein
MFINNQTILPDLRSLKSTDQTMIQPGIVKQLIMRAGVTPLQK